MHICMCRSPHKSHPCCHLLLLLLHPLRLRPRMRQQCVVGLDTRTDAIACLNQSSELGGGGWEGREAAEEGDRISIRGVCNMQMCV